MKVLITGAKGFVGKNLAESLKNIRDGKDRTHPALDIEQVFEYSRENTMEELETFCREADFVFHLAGVNRSEKAEDFHECNVAFSQELISCLKRQNNRCPLLFSSSIRAKDGDSAYARTKRKAEELFLRYGEESDVEILIYRLPNLFGKWCRPNYNSVVATFCHNRARELPLRVDAPERELELLYIDDLVQGFLQVLEGKICRCEDGNGAFCTVPGSHRVTLQRIVDLLEQFHDQPKTLFLAEIPAGSFEKKLYSTYLSYLPMEKAVADLQTKADERGSFTEVLKSAAHGQFSVNISNPGCTKGQHWHHSKWELFIVVAGEGLIQQRKIGSEEVEEFAVSGDKLQAVYMRPGYTHSLINRSQTENLVTLMWANETFDPAQPDTFYEEI